MPLTPPPTSQDHSSGNEDASIILVQYGDFECPYSGAAYWAVKDVQEELGDKLRYIFRHFPLHDIHPHAMIAAEAAEAAGAQDRFWPMYEILFEKQDELSVSALVSYARHIGLNEERFVEELRAHVYRERIHQSLEHGRQTGVKGTPTFFINGTFHGNREGLWDTEALLEAIATS